MSRPEPMSRITTKSGGGRYLVTRTLIVANVAAFVYALANGADFFSINPSVLYDGALVARRWGILSGSIGVDTGEYYRLVTSAFLHDGIMHLAFNMYALWLLGQLLESAMGAARFVTLFVVSMLGGAAGVMLLDPNVYTVGASGAVFGLLGTMAMIQKLFGGSLWRSPLGMLLLINLALTFAVPNISKGGHFGGLLAGLGMGWVILRCQRRAVHNIVPVLVGVVLSAGLVALSLWGASRWQDPVLSVISERI